MNVFLLILKIFLAPFWLKPGIVGLFEQPDKTLAVA
jgi:hypothetical protein